MSPAGLREVARAREDGRWDRAYPSPRAAVVPNDLKAALDAEPEATKAFAALDGINRYAILHRVHDARRPETRASRIAKYVDMLRRGETIHAVRRPRKIKT